MRWFWPLAIVGGAFLLGAGKARADHEDWGRKMDKSERRRRLRCAIAAAGMADDWLRFLEVTAYRESRWNPTALNDTPNEVARSKAALRRIQKNQPKNWERLQGLGDPWAWGFGSKGLFQFLGPYVAMKSTGWRFPPGIVSVDMAYDPGISVAAAFDFARGLMRRSEFDGSWASLRVGWGLPIAMSDPEKLAEKGAAMEARAADLGWQPGWVRDAPTPLPARNPEALAGLAAAARVAYEGCE